ncbi:hypothetical protein D3C72_2481090 [compost metagenome]
MAVLGLISTPVVLSILSPPLISKEKFSLITISVSALPIKNGDTANPALFGVLSVAIG